MDLIALIETYRREQRDDHKEVMDELRKVSDVQGDHSTRLTVLENDRKTARWFIGVAISALIVAVIGWMHHG